MKSGNASFSTVILRFYLMMAFVIIPFVLGVPYLAILSLPVFLSALLGLTFDPIFATSSKKKDDVKSDKFNVPNMSVPLAS